MATYTNDTFMNAQSAPQPKRQWTHDLFFEISSRDGELSYVAILLPKPDGPVLWHQYGGLQCKHRQLQGVFVWVECSAQFAALTIEKETLGEPLTGLTIELIETTLAQKGLGNVAYDYRAPAYEALVPVKWHGQDAWLIWENSD